MRKSLITIVIALFILTTSSIAKQYVPYNSIQPIQQLDDEGILKNVCTSFSINKAKGYWLTARHCALDGTMFHNKPITWIGYNDALDLAIFEADFMDSIKLATGPPQVGDEVIIIGYPLGSIDPIVFFGRVSNPLARVDATQTKAIFNLIGLPGNSGGPILDKSGRLIGIGQLSNGAGLAWGISWKALADSLQGFID